MKLGTLLPAAAGAMFAAFPAHAEMQGDAEAIDLAHQLVENIGGAEVWSKIKVLYVIEKSRHPNYGDGLIGTFWRDLLEPRETYTIQNENISFAKGWTSAGGWTQNSKGEITLKTAGEIAAQEGHYWPGEIYVMYGRFARGDETLRLETGPDARSFVAYDAATDRKLGTFWLNADGDMYRWRHGDEEDLTEYVYGPHKQFGAISFPAWGTMYDGSWSLDYVEVRGYGDDMEIDFSVPEKK